MIALTSATGKLGSAVLSAILDNKLIDPKELIVCVGTNISLKIESLIGGLLRHHRTRKTHVLTAFVLNPSSSAKPISMTHLLLRAHTQDVRNSSLSPRRV